MQPDWQEGDPELNELAEATDRVAAWVKEPTIRTRLREIARQVRAMAHTERLGPRPSV